MKKIIVSILSCFLIAAAAFSQKPVIPGWHLLDKATDGYEGISIKKAYAFEKNKKPLPVIVAVIDGGSDTTHEDLKSRLWVNEKEIPGNGKDDDHNGYPDDVYGWNFLGNSKGENITKENLEVIRLYHLMKDEYENKPIDSSSLDQKKKNNYRLWQKIEDKLNVTDEDKFTFRMVVATSQTMANQDTIIQNAMGKKEYSLAELEKASFEDMNAKRARFGFLRATQMFQFEPEVTNTDIFSDFNDFIDHEKQLIDAKVSPFTDYRKIIPGTYDDFNDRFYGNNDIMGGDAKHGTHVAGIIAGVEDNGVGIDGVAKNALIMTIRTVPDGDEYDKDVALAIRYAADNGAKVVNMSFGKEFSPQQHWVEDAIKYAAEKDVLLVHAAGNDSKNLDEEEQFPTPFLSDHSIAANMITVGASGDSSIKSGMIATFTNFGSKTVDVLAPGVKIYSTIPTGNRYSFQDGTSMAAPVVSGIAALIRGYYPNLTAPEVKQILIQSVNKPEMNPYYPKPGGEKDEKVTMDELSLSGGIVNAYQALVLADKVATEKSKKSSSKK